MQSASIQLLLCSLLAALALPVAAQEAPAPVLAAQAAEMTYPSQQENPWVTFFIGLAVGVMAGLVVGIELGIRKNQQPPPSRRTPPSPRV